jgi:hypothetical protein
LVAAHDVARSPTWRQRSAPYVDAVDNRRSAAPQRYHGALRHRVAAASMLAVPAVAIVWMLWTQPFASTRPLAVPEVKPQFALAAPIPIKLAADATIVETIAGQLTVYRLAANPDIVVLDFPSLYVQGATFNRVASLTEQAGLPRDTVLTDAALEAAVVERDATVPTYYYSHAYRADELAYFFATADRQHQVLNSDEEWLRALLRQLGWFAPGATGALVSVPRVDDTVSEATRATMLQHELARGEFFSDPEFASYVRSFWLNVMTDHEREAFRHFLGAMGYDTDDEELMYNQMQAYVMFTYDDRFFSSAKADISPVRRAQLQAAFLRNMPDCWLKPVLALHLQQAQQAQR